MGLIQILLLQIGSGNQRWRPVTESVYETTCSSACTHDINEIPTAVPMFSRLGNNWTNVNTAVCRGE